jgi:hypothetical protein
VNFVANPSLRNPALCLVSIDTAERQIFPWHTVFTDFPTSRVKRDCGDHEVPCLNTLYFMVFLFTFGEFGQVFLVVKRFLVKRKSGRHLRYSSETTVLQNDIAIRNAGGKIGTDKFCSIPQR